MKSIKFESGGGVSFFKYVQIKLNCMCMNDFCFTNTDDNGTISMTDNYNLIVHYRNNAVVML